MITIRPATVEDAAAFLALRAQIDHETKFMMLEPGERQTTVEQERERLAAVHQSDNKQTFLAEDSGQLVGWLWANGGEFRGRKVGTFGRVGIFSLQMNKNATAGEGGLIVTDDAKLYERCVAAHDLGIPWVDGAPCETGPESVVWGCGRRMSELCGAVASVQLAKLPAILGHMRASKQRIKALLAGTPGIELRRLADEAGDTGPFLIVILADEARAVAAVERIKAAGICAASRLADFGLHIYSNIPQLTGKVPLSPAGNPWNLAENKDSVYDYRRGACPASDALFERSIILPIPSKLAPLQEEAAAKIIREAVG